MSVAPVLLLVAVQAACSAAVPAAALPMSDPATVLPSPGPATAPPLSDPAAVLPSPGPVTGLALEGEAAEEFLRTAEVVELQQYDSKGITRPRKATLSDGERTFHAVFKDVDIIHDKTKLTTGKTLFKLKDSYKHEIAAYELDKLLELGLVPPCVERKIRGTKGSLCMWVEDGMTEWQRSKEKKIQPPDVMDYNNQMHDIKLLLQLDWDADYNNTSNIMMDGNWRLYKVDNSRAFRADPKLRRAETLSRFRRSNADALRNLDRAVLDEAMGPWLSPKAINALWKRRNAIVEIIDELIASKPEAAVLFD